MSDSYCKGCRDSEAGCERCLPAREERERQRKRAEADQAVLDAWKTVPAAKLREWAGRDVYAGDSPLGTIARAELARRELKP